MDRKTLKHIAQLSRISLNDKELEEFTPQMQTILDSAKILQETNTKGVQPMKRHIPFSQLREDIPSLSLTQKEVLKNAKYSESGYVKVFGKVFEGEAES